MKRRTGYLGTSAGTVGYQRPRSLLGQMQQAQALGIAAAHARVAERFPNILAALAADEQDQAGGADKPRE